MLPRSVAVTLPSRPPRCAHARFRCRRPTRDNPPVPGAPTRRIVGVLPAAGYATRLAPLGLAGSKELLPVDGRPLLDHAVHRARLGGAGEVRVVTRPDKADVRRRAEVLGATVVLARPASAAASVAAGTDGLAPDDVALVVFPDTVWEPEDGLARLVARLVDGVDAVLGCFRWADARRGDTVELGPGGRVASLEVKPPAPRSDLVWGCAAVRVGALAGLSGREHVGDLLAERLADLTVLGVVLSDRYVDVGTPESVAAVAGRGGS